MKSCREARRGIREAARPGGARLALPVAAAVELVLEAAVPADVTSLAAGRAHPSAVPS
jgi:hypothetical protein